MCIIAVVMYFLKDEPKAAMDIVFISAMTIVCIILVIAAWDLIAYTVEKRRINKIFHNFNKQEDEKENN